MLRNLTVHLLLTRFLTMRLKVCVCRGFRHPMITCSRADAATTNSYKVRHHCVVEEG